MRVLSLAILGVLVLGAGSGALASASASPVPGSPAGSSGATVAASLATPADPPTSAPQVVATVGVGLEPVAAAYDPANGFVYVANIQSDNITVLNGTTLVAWINLNDSLLEEPAFVVYDPLNQLVYVVDEYDFANGLGAVTVISGLTVVATLNTGEGSNSAVLDPVNGDLYVTDFLTDQVSVIDEGGNATIANLTVGQRPVSAAYDPLDGDVYVANQNSSNVSVLFNLSVIGSLPAGTSPSSVAYDPADQDVYVANNNSSNVTVYHNQAGVGNVGVGAHPEFLAYDPSLGDVEVVDSGASLLTIINGTTAVATIDVASDPVWVGQGPGDPFTYVAGASGSVVSVLNGTLFVQNNTVGKMPVYGVADPAHGYEDILDYGSNAVTVLSPGYAVTFNETGLTGGTSWTVSLGSSTLSSTSASIRFLELPGSYAYTIGIPSGYQLVSSVPASPVLVTDTGVTVNVTFAPITGPLYNLTFKETGLGCGSSQGGHGRYATSSGGAGCCSGQPMGSSMGGGCCGHSTSSNLTWNVTVAGVTKSTNGSSITFQEPNGAYAYLVGPPAGYGVSKSVPASPVTINGANVTVNVTFAPIVALSITFVESGLPYGTTWCVYVNTMLCSSSNHIVVSGLSAGTYAFTVSPVHGYTASPASGSVVLTNRSVTVQIRFSSPHHGCGG